jgi:hypothetical protein
MEGAQSATLTQLNQFFDYIASSSLMDQLAEYNVSGYNISHGRRIGTTTVDSPLGASITDSAIQQPLQQLIASSNVPQPTSDSLYFFYLPPEAQVVMGGSASCRAFCGYHNHISGQILYAVMPFPGCPGCLGSLPLFDALTSTSSHELCEVITDPIPGQGRYDDTHGEIGDICAWKTQRLGSCTVQLEWSNGGAYAPKPE